MLGPSGCGKTTTLRMIAGFEEPTSGQILLHGRDMVGVPPFRRDVNMVFQQYALFPHMDVFENVAFGLRRKKVDKDEIRRRVAEALALVELEGREKRKPRQLSGGQQQRVALARALVNRPRALLLDEPLGALDLKLRQNMQLELKRIQREVGITFVYVTHDQEEALTMSDRLVVMNAGRIEQLGSPRELYEHPATRFVANFIGTSNILTGRLERRGDAWALAGLGPDQRVLFADAGQRPVRARTSSWPSGPRRSCCGPSRTRPRPASSALRAKVDEIVYLGTSTQYRTVTDGGDAVAVYRQNASATPGADVLDRPGGMAGMAAGAHLCARRRHQGGNHCRDQEPTARPRVAARDDHAADQPPRRPAGRRPARRLRLPRRLRRGGVVRRRRPPGLRVLGQPDPGRAARLRQLAATTWTPARSAARPCTPRSRRSPRRRGSRSTTKRSSRRTTPSWARSTPRSRPARTPGGT